MATTQRQAHKVLAEIAEKTPVTKAVRAGTEIRTTIDRA